MTTLYRPVPITSAEQAEALPMGTVAFETGDQGQATGASIRVRGGWHCTGYCLDFEGAEVLKHSDMVGDTALVPIEAEEEMHSIHTRGQTTPEWRTRLVTPWEEAQ